MKNTNKIDIKEKLDRMNILEKADLIRNRAQEIKSNNRTLNNLVAFEIASKEILRGQTWKF